MADFQTRFVAFAVQQQVIRFGEFKTKAGRLSPYFFNAGLFSTGAALRQLSKLYADAIEATAPSFDFLFGPAYKGIPLVAGIAMAMAERGRDIPFCYNRKEAKDHGEGGMLVGAPPLGRALIVDDVISAGTSVRESVALLTSVGAQPVAVVTALDRMERGNGTLSATQEVTAQFGIPVLSIASLNDLMRFLSGHTELAAHAQAVAAYREQYGVDAID